MAKMPGMDKQMVSGIMELWDRAAIAPPPKWAEQWADFTRDMVWPPFDGPFTDHCSACPMKGQPMKWHRPVQNIKNEIQEPIQQIAVVAMIALSVAVLALLVALGRKA